MPKKGGESEATSIPAAKKEREEVRAKAIAS